MVFAISFSFFQAVEFYENFAKSNRLSAIIY
ncbi:hypothetical protein AM202_04831 [Actinobacillus minor 202]|uniref:Uncharacterized protein n=1 Tax=Actinobacillus minor 202 TaxID=591023 RepID=A0ABM9YSJ4_9PAST|nr:hypothetical protein AM202_04831 [Actinobacillus minor 202]